jgi:hypothetical protein
VHAVLWRGIQIFTETKYVRAGKGLQRRRYPRPQLTYSARARESFGISLKGTKMDLRSHGMAHNLCIRYSGPAWDLNINIYKSAL